MKGIAAPRTILAGLILALGMGAVLALLDQVAYGQGSFRLSGWAAYSALSALALAAILGVRQLIGGDAGVTRAALAAFLTRLLVGVTLAVLLPIYGYQDSQVTRAGYLFYDAYLRDRQAWDLASSGRPLGVAFQGEYSGDQYGGLLALSAGVYRALSPDMHRPALILILTALAGALGVFFLWKATRAWFGEATAQPAAWIFALYPEAIILGASQMREAFLMSGIALALLGLTELRSTQLHQGIWVLIAGLVMFAFSPPVALAALGISFVAWLLDPQQRISWKQVGLFVGLLLLGTVLVFFVLAQYPSLERAGPWRIWIQWLEKNFGFQAYLLERSSGWVQKLFSEAGERWQSAIVVIYGVARPVLPATLVDGAWIWRAINSLRAAGWYALAPLLVYAATRSAHPANGERRAQLVWLSLAAWAWILIAAFVAGGDQIDNPRYRTMLIAWQAMLAAWAWWWARAHRDPWLRRWLLVEGVFLIFFTNWYVSRYYRWIGRLPFWQMVAAILALSGLILVGGWLRDLRRRT